MSLHILHFILRELESGRWVKEHIGRSFIKHNWLYISYNIHNWLDVGILKINTLVWNIRVNVQRPRVIKVFETYLCVDPVRIRKITDVS